jgi:hypothetical protein
MSKTLLPVLMICLLTIIALQAAHASDMPAPAVEPNKLGAPITVIDDNSITVKLEDNEKWLALDRQASSPRLSHVEGRLLAFSIEFSGALTWIWDRKNPVNSGIVYQCGEKHILPFLGASEDPNKGWEWGEPGGAPSANGTEFSMAMNTTMTYFWSLPVECAARSLNFKFAMGNKERSLSLELH